MEVKVAKATFSKDFLVRLQKGVAKGAYAEVTTSGGKILVTALVKSRLGQASPNFRVLGRYKFYIEDDSYVLQHSHTIEKDYYPWEIALTKLLKYSKTNKVKTVVLK